MFFFINLPILFDFSSPFSLLNDKMHLLIRHYSRALTAPTAAKRHTDRVLADLFVLMTDYFDAEMAALSEVLQKFVDWRWLDCRLLYEQISEDAIDSSKTSYFISIFIPEMDKFLIDNKKWLNDTKKFANALTAKEKAIVAETELRWFESQEKHAKPSEIVQKIHFEQIKKLKKDENIQKIFKEIKTDKNAQLNLLQIVTKEDALKLMEEIEAEYGKKELEEEKEKEEKKKTKNEKKKNKRKEKKKNKAGKSSEEATMASKNETELEEQKEGENANGKEKKEKERGEKRKEEKGEKEKEEKERGEKRKEEKKDKEKENTTLNATESYSNNLSELCHDSILNQKYKNYILNDFDENSIEMLSLGAYVNEIEHRIKMIENINKIENLNNFLDRNKAQNLIEKWEKTKTKLDEIKLENKNQFSNLEEKLYEILRKFLLFVDRKSQLMGGHNARKKGEKANLKKQMHLKNILTALVEDKEMGQIWMNFDNEMKQMKMIKLIPIQMQYLKIDEQMAKWQKMMAQIEIDKELFHKNAIDGDEQQQKYLNPTFPLYSQQITVANAAFLMGNSTRKFEIYLTNLLYENIYFKKNFEQKRDTALAKINALVDKWSNGLARLLVSGSLLLNAHTIGSDVNLLCVTPGERLNRNDFMGNDKNGKCVENKCTNEAVDDAKSLFCQICENKGSADLIKIESDSIWLIRFTFDGIEFDISLVAVPKLENLVQKIDDNELSNLLAEFDWSTHEHKHMIRSLSSFRSTQYIFHLFYKETEYQNVNERNESGKTFQLLLIILKIWAKNHYIYSNKMGFLNGMTLAIMAAKIMLLYPNSILPFLLEKFFLFYNARLSKIPIKLSTNGNDFLPNANLFLTNNLEFEMPVLSPSFPVQNAARLVTHSNAKVIRRQMFEALNNINSMKNNKFEVEKLVSNSIPFSEKYDNFIVINCVAEEKDKGDAFCGFVEWRLRLQIIFDIDKKGGGIETHLYPNVYQEKCTLAPNFVKTSFLANHCQVWLLGIVNSAAAIGQNVAVMAQQFDMTIKQHYYLRNNKSANHQNIDHFYKAMKMELMSIEAKKEQLI